MIAEITFRQVIWNIAQPKIATYNGSEHFPGRNFFGTIGVLYNIIGIKIWLMPHTNFSPFNLVGFIIISEKDWGENIWFVEERLVIWIGPEDPPNIVLDDKNSSVYNSNWSWIRRERPICEGLAHFKNIVFALESISNTFCNYHRPHSNSSWLISGFSGKRLSEHDPYCPFKVFGGMLSD